MMHSKQNALSLKQVQQNQKTSGAYWFAGKNINIIIFSRKN
jgi:hypothetical protein